MNTEGDLPWLLVYQVLSIASVLDLEHVCFLKLYKIAATFSGDSRNSPLLHSRYIL